VRGYLVSRANVLKKAAPPAPPPAASDGNQHQEN
jgi:hypothetical protein